MKRLFTLLTILTLLAVSACNKDGVKYAFQLQQSNNALQQFKKANNNSYSYQVTFGSWTGYYTETTITVKEGKVIERAFASKERLGNNQTLTPLEDWIEDETQLGTHTLGFHPLTLDEVYKKAKEDWLKERDNANTYLETKNNGMISLCGYSLKQCQDDCFQGIVIKFIRPL